MHNTHIMQQALIQAFHEKEKTLITIHGTENIQIHCRRKMHVQYVQECCLSQENVLAHNSGRQKRKLERNVKRKNYKMNGRKT